MEFAIVRKGYDPKQVDAYLEKLTRQYDDATLERTDRIEELKHENARLQEQITRLQDKQQTVELLLEQAADKAKEMEYASKVRYCLEGERIRLFRAKWTEYCTRQTSGMWQEQDAAMQRTLARAEEELRTLMASQLNIGPYVNQAVFDHAQEVMRLQPQSEGDTAEDKPQEVSA